MSGNKLSRISLDNCLMLRSLLLISTLFLIIFVKYRCFGTDRSAQFIDERDEKGQTALFHAVFERDNTLVRKLVNKGASWQQSDFEGQTPRDYAQKLCHGYEWLSQSNWFEAPEYTIKRFLEGQKRIHSIMVILRAYKRTLQNYLPFSSLHR